MIADTADFLVVGGGVVGLTIALELRHRFPDQSVVLLEKEKTCGEHASGRNSGVLHAGFYYSSDSMKARFSREGCARWKLWCADRDLPVNESGKLVVARDEEEIPRLQDLFGRGRANGVQVELIDAAAARQIEPRVRTTDWALWSPTTSSVDPARIMAALEAEAKRIGVQIHTGTTYLESGLDAVVTSAGTISCGFVVNAAGLYADRVARDYGFGMRYRILPFKGLYLYGDVPKGWLRTHVYPVPEPGMPFLGVHFTVKVDGAISVGPTALPALWREQYAGLGRFSATELLDVTRREAAMFVTSGPFRRLAFREAPKISRAALARMAAPLVEGLEIGQWRRWGAPGIRAQLLEVATGELVSDFVVEGDERSLHVLNAVSPAFTCALPFAEHVVDRIEG